MEREEVDGVTNLNTSPPHIFSIQTPSCLRRPSCAHSVCLCLRFSHMEARSITWSSLLLFKVCAFQCFLTLWGGMRAEKVLSTTIPCHLHHTHSHHYPQPQPQPQSYQPQSQLCRKAQRLRDPLSAVATWPPVLLFAPSCRRSSFFVRPPCRRPRRLFSPDEEVQSYLAHISVPRHPSRLFDAIL